jgi:F-type H+-transporting ATPase subunit delta
MFLLEPIDGSTQVNIPSTAGDMGILSNHVPSIVQLRPGIVEVIAEGSQPERYFGILLS